MSISIMPNTVEMAEYLERRMAEPVRARFAIGRVCDVASADDLLDRLQDAELIGRDRDVRVIFSNWIAQAFFSQEDPREMASPEVIEILDRVALQRFDDADLLPEMKRFSEADLRPMLPAGDWRVVEEEGGFDLFALSGDGDMWRFSRLDGTMREIHPTNRGRYVSLFEHAPETMP